jgi:Ca2+-binding EF-hand superfamily protein
MQGFVTEIGDASSVSWIVFLVLCLFNFLRLELIDPPLLDTICPKYYYTSTLQHVPNSNNTYTENIVTADDEEQCRLYYTLSFACFVMLFLCLLVYVAFTVTSHYFDHLIQTSLRVIDNIDFERSGRFGYKRALEAMIAEEASLEQAYHSKRSGSHRDHDNDSFSGDDDYDDGDSRTFQLYTSNRSTNSSRSKRNPLGDSVTQSRNEFKSYRDLAKEMEAIKARERKDRGEFNQRSSMRRHQQQPRSPVPEDAQSVTSSGIRSPTVGKSISSFVERHSNLVEEEEDLQHTEIRHIFYKQSPWLYFRFVEAVLFLQCVYLAFWACQLMPMVYSAQHSSVSLSVGMSGLWVIVLTVPPFVFNMHLLNITVTKTVLLRAVCGVDKEIVGLVCDEIIAESKAVAEFRDRVRRKLTNQHTFGNTIKQSNDLFGASVDSSINHFATTSWRPHIQNVQQLFYKYDSDGSGTLNKSEFRQFLEDLDIFLGHHTYTLLWSRIDVDASNSISLDELMLILFPEYKREFKLNLSITEKLREEIAAKNPLLNKSVAHVANNNVQQPSPETLRQLKLKFEVLDTNKNGSLDKEEFRALLDSLNVTNLTDRSFNVLFACAADSISSDDTISFDEFVELVYPEYQRHQPSSSSSSALSPGMLGRSNNKSMKRGGSQQRDSKSFKAPKQLSSPSMKQQHVKLDHSIMHILSDVNKPTKSGSGSHSEPTSDQEKKEDDTSVHARTPSKPAKPTHKPSAADHDADAVAVVKPVPMTSPATSPYEYTAVSPVESGPEELEIVAAIDDDAVEPDVNNPASAGAGAGAGAKKGPTKNFKPIDARLRTASGDECPTTLRPARSGSTPTELVRPKRAASNAAAPSNFPVSDREDVVIYVVPKGATELGLGLAEHTLETVRDEQHTNFDDDNNDGNDDTVERTVAHVRVASIRSKVSGNKPHPSGLRINDVIHSVNGVQYDNYADLISALSITNSVSGSGIPNNNPKEHTYHRLELSSRGEVEEPAASKHDKPARTSGKLSKKLSKKIRSLTFM